MTAGRRVPPPAGGGVSTPGGAPGGAAAHWASAAQGAKPLGGRRAGVVVAFDDAVGLGVVEARDSGGAAPEGARYRFHCTQIAGGSRTIRPGASVTFDVAPGRGGQWEAANVAEQPRGGPGS